MGCIAEPLEYAILEPITSWWSKEVNYNSSAVGISNFFQNTPQIQNQSFYEIGIALLVPGELASSHCENPEWAIVVSAMGGFRGPYSYNHFYYTIKQGGMRNPISGEMELGLRVVEKRTALTYTSETSAESSVVARIYVLGSVQATGPSGMPRQFLQNCILSLVHPFEPRDNYVGNADGMYRDYSVKGNSRAWVLRVLEYMHLGHFPIYTRKGWGWVPLAVDKARMEMLTRYGVPLDVRSPEMRFGVFQERILAHWREKAKYVTIYDKPSIPLDFMKEFYG